MKPMKKLAKQIAGTSSPHSIKVKVIDKTNVHTSSDNSLEYQIITFEDGEVQLIPGQTSYDPDEPVYHIYFNRKTTIQPVFGPDSTYLPEYILLASIPREFSIDDRYDVLGVVIYVGQNYKVPRQNGQPWDVCDVFIIDHSSEQMMIVTVWGDLTINLAINLQSIVPSFPVIGFTALRTSYQKGFSLATTYLTFINFHPHGDNAAALRAWGEANMELLTAKHQKICEVRCPQTQRSITTIQTLLQKKVQNTLQEEQHWLQVQLKEFDHTRVRLYLGCSECGIGNCENIGDAYNCTACFTENAISTPRLSVTFEATDETGAYFFTALAKNAEALLEVDAKTLYSMLPQERKDYLGQVERQIRSTPIYIQVVPTNALSRTQVLGWLLKQVSLT